MKKVLLVLALVGCSSGHAEERRETTATSAGSEAPPPAADPAPADPAPIAPAPEAAPPPAGPPASADELVSAEIPNPCADGRVRLSGGAGEYPSTIGLETPGGLELTPIATMDLDGDGRAEMLAYVLCMPGGSGTIDSVRAYHVEGDQVVEVARIEGGDRAEGGLDRPTVTNGNVVVSRFSGSETMCCPTHATSETWRLRRGRFTRTHVGPRLPVEH